MIKEKIKEILEKNLSKGSIPSCCKTDTRPDLDYQKIGSPDLLVANILCGEFHIDDPNIIANIGLFIAQSWVDIEINEQQIEDITNEFVQIYKDLLNEPYGHNS